jgi:hypothetical protein
VAAFLRARSERGGGGSGARSKQSDRPNRTRLRRLKTNDFLASHRHRLTHSTWGVVKQAASFEGWFSSTRGCGCGRCFAAARRRRARAAARRRRAHLSFSLSLSLPPNQSFASLGSRRGLGVRLIRVTQVGGTEVSARANKKNGAGGRRGEVSAEVRRGEGGTAFLLSLAPAPLSLLSQQQASSRARPTSNAHAPAPSAEPHTTTTHTRRRANTHLRRLPPRDREREQTAAFPPAERARAHTHNLKPP